MSVIKIRLFVNKNGDDNEKIKNSLNSLFKERVQYLTVKEVNDAEIPRKGKKEKKEKDTEKSATKGKTSTDTTDTEKNSK